VWWEKERRALELEFRLKIRLGGYSTQNISEHDDRIEDHLRLKDDWKQIGHSRRF